jgi:hypothetical protein
MKPVQRDFFRWLILIPNQHLSVQKHGDGSVVKTLQEKGWLKLFSSVQKSKLIKAEKLKLTLDLLDMMYKSGTRVNAMHICAAITVSLVFCCDSLVSFLKESCDHF